MVPNILKKYSAFLAKGQAVHEEHPSRTIGIIHPITQHQIPNDQDPHDMPSFLPLCRMHWKTDLGIKETFAVFWRAKWKVSWQDLYSKIKAIVLLVTVNKTYLCVYCISWLINSM